MEIEKENYPADETDLEESLNQTGFLLQRLRELQAWQQEQERQLLREQELQIGRLCSANNQVIAFFWSCSLKIVLKIWHSCNLTTALKCNYCIILAQEPFWFCHAKLVSIILFFSSRKLFLPLKQTMTTQLLAKIFQGIIILTLVGNINSWETWATDGLHGCLMVKRSWVQFQLSSVYFYLDRHCVSALIKDLNSSGIWFLISLESLK